MLMKIQCFNYRIIYLGLLFYLTFILSYFLNIYIDHLLVIAYIILFLR